MQPNISTSVIDSKTIKTMKPVSIILFLIFCFNLPIKGRDLDFSGMNAFYKLVETLMNDREPGEVQWNALFKTQAYAYLLEHENKEDFFRKYFPMVFMPSRRNILDKELKQLEGYKKRVLEHFISVKSHMDELREYQEKLSGIDLIKQSKQRTREYLPEGIIDKYAPPPVCFAIFEPDGKASEKLIVVDLYFAMQIDIEGFLAHELHHYYVSRMTDFQLPAEENDYYYLLRSLRQLQLEGTADRIDKKGIISKKSKNWYEENYSRAYHNSNMIFSKIDSILTDIKMGASEKKGFTAMWNVLPFGAHPNGYFMAELIESKIGKNALIGCLDNPFKFFYLYNQAASDEKGCYKFSDTTINLVKRIEKKLENAGNTD